MADIDVGLAAIVRNISKVAGWTYIVEDNPANASGTIKRVDIYAKWQFTGLQIGIFYSTGTDKFSTRSYTTITTGIVTAGFHSYPVDLNIEEGDRIGFYASSGDNLYAGQSTTTGVWEIEGDYIPCTNVVFVHITDNPCGLVSLYGTYILAVVTTQAVTDITHNSATGNGNITNINGENCSKRGVCWNTTGSPTVADEKSEETGSFGTGAFTGSITGLDPGTKYYVKAYTYNSCGYAYGAEVDFTTDKIAPTVTTQDATEISQSHVKGNGNITSTGGENCSERGFEYGLTKIATWTKKETGSYEAGAFNLVIDGLQANTEYWYRAYAKNTVDPFYGYGEWVQFQTSASGTISTGTRISICSDYSGYTYKLNASLTDDGETYESFFVLSTDLAQGLHIKKRLLDIFSYFTKKENGTAKIYIKQDNETEWNYAGEISFSVGDEDIIIPHLPVDFLAKHYLIKFLFENDFEFIGLITESILIGTR